MNTLTNNNELTISFQQNLYYSTTKPLHVTEVIKSLSGLSSLVKSTKPVLNKLLDVEIGSIELYIKTIEEGSLKENTFVKLFFNSQEEYDNFLKKIHDKFGDKAMKTAGVVILTVVSGLSLFGLYKAATASSENGVIAIDSYNTINNYYVNAPLWDNAAELMKITPDKFKQTIESTIKNRKTVAQSSLDLLSPVKDDHGAELFIGTEHVLDEPLIPESVAKSVPHGKIEFSSIEDVVDYPNVDIQIRALDLDNPKKGWAGIIPNLIDYRVKIEVADDVDQAKLKINKTISADVSVEMKKDNSTGQLKATKITLLKIH
ncbi:hypothetical protein ACIO08_04330 [Avibacterium paragallinarum]|uniref:hypothetical protein n=1 Tax=Avibacterium paragallinarum TaxID=728 RepID=UPI00397D74B0